MLTFSSKDWPFFFKENLDALPLVPQLWDITRNNGFGENIAYVLWLRVYRSLPSNILHNFFGFDWFPIEIVIFFLAIFIIGILSTFLFGKLLFGKSVLLRVIVSIVYLTNTYILMIVSGGQMGVALAYAIAPLVITVFVRVIILMKNTEFSLIQAITLAIPFAIQMLFDLRITTITVGILGLYALYHFFLIEKYNLFFCIKNMLAAAIIVLGLHAFWIFPFLFSPISIEFHGVNSNQFLSFADFSNSLALLHPNWPENIFGKTYFMRPEFILLPILAFGSLLFLADKTRKDPSSPSRLERASAKQNAELPLILFFVLLGLIGAFLAKGTNEPVGELYLFLFEHVPGFFMFRDPTKFYIMVALSYSALIPFSVYELTEWIYAKFKKPVPLRRRGGQSAKIQFKTKNYMYPIISIAVILYILFLIRPAIFNQLKGTFQIYTVPREYVLLKDFLNDQNDFFRVLWVTQRQRFGYYSHMHPFVDANILFKKSSAKDIVATLKGMDKKISNAHEYIVSLGIKYIIIPYDSQREIFLKDRKYDVDTRESLEKEIATIPWLRRIEFSKEIAVFEVERFVPDSLFMAYNQDHGTIENTVQWKRFSETNYELINIPKNATGVFFSQQYDPGWEMVVDTKSIASKPLGTSGMYFPLPNTYKRGTTVVYAPQRFADRGVVVSLLTALALCAYVALRKFRKAAT